MMNVECGIVDSHTGLVLPFSHQIISFSKTSVKTLLSFEFPCVISWFDPWLFKNCLASQFISSNVTLLLVTVIIALQVHVLYCSCKDQIFRWETKTASLGIILREY